VINRADEAALLARPPPPRLGSGVRRGSIFGMDRHTPVTAHFAQLAISGNRVR
jgi:hypothetical protein